MSAYQRTSIGALILLVEHASNCGRFRACIGDAVRCRPNVAVLGYSLSSCRQPHSICPSLSVAPSALLVLSARLNSFCLWCLCAAVAAARTSDVGGKVGQERFRSLGSPEDCDRSLEVPRRQDVEVDLVVAPNRSVG
jgi:hypothetical protein